MADDHSGTPQPQASSSAGPAELQPVVLTAPQSESGDTWGVGARGCIVFVHRGGAAFEVEFPEPQPGVITVEAGALAAAL